MNSPQIYNTKKSFCLLIMRVLVLPSLFILTLSCKDTDGKVEGTVTGGILDSSSNSATSCTDDVINTASCTTQTSRYVTASAGADITTYDNSSSSTSVTSSIPTGFYSGASVIFTDSNLTAANIKSGTSIFGVTGNFTGAYSSCTDDSLNASQCSTATNRYVTATSGANITSYTNASATTSITASIPTGFYSGKSVTFTDANLTATNIKSGTSVFGVTGNLTSAYSSCTDDSLNASQCSTAASRYVTATSGANITSYTNASATTSITASIPTGFYSGKSVTFTDANLTAANIKSGTSIFGVSGSHASASGAVILEHTYTTSGTGTSTCNSPSCASGYTSLGCAVAGGGGSSNSSNFTHSIRSGALTDAVTGNFSSACTHTYTSANTYNKTTCLRLCVQ